MYVCVHGFSRASKPEPITLRVHRTTIVIMRFYSPLIYICMFTPPHQNITWNLPPTLAKSSFLIPAPLEPHVSLGWLHLHTYARLFLDSFQSHAYLHPLSSLLVAAAATSALCVASVYSACLHALNMRSQPRSGASIGKWLTDKTPRAKTQSLPPCCCWLCGLSAQLKLSIKIYRRVMKLSKHAMQGEMQLRRTLTRRVLSTCCNVFTRVEIPDK